MKHNLRVALIPSYLLLCLVLGGASAAGLAANMVLQLCALPILIWAFVTRRQTPMPLSARQLAGLAALVLLLILLQLVPLPPAIWTSLPGRGQIAEGFRLLGMPLPSLPWSLNPAHTLASALWLLPAAAALFGVIRLGSFRESWLAIVIVVAALLSVLIGALQLLGGEESPWYFYAVTNYGAAVGFFANSNHLATLLVAALPFLAALYLHTRRRGESAKRTSGRVVILLGATAIVVVGIAINASLAALGLTVPVAAASVLMIVSRRKRVPIWAVPAVALLTVAAVYLVFAGPASNNLTSDEARTAPLSRYTSFTNSIEAVKDYMPAGSGVGTFVDIYPDYEDEAAISSFYMNHVHSDYIELALETGLPGVLLILLFLAWWVRRTVTLWTGDEADSFARAATIASGAILAHSMVDYPARTAAIAALLAVCCALMTRPRPRGRPVQRPTGRHLSAD